jgi:6-phosphofructo-2-kinase/fructose-2,6-biphosphatase 2
MIVIITRHGESYNNFFEIIGGNSSLTEAGIQYAKQLNHYLNTKYEHIPITVWTSTLKRTKETSSYLNPDYIYKEFKELDEINSGEFENLSLIEIEEKYNEHFVFRNSDKLNRSYPNGETYTDLYARVSNVIEKNFDDITTDVLLIISHQAVCRVLHACMGEISLEDCVSMDIDLHTLYGLQ